MLEIINPSGEIMEVSSTITVERYNPLFNDADKLFQDISYPGKAPMTKANIRFFNSAHLVETGNEVYEFPVQVNILGVQFFVATCACKVAGKFFEFTLKPDFASIAAKTKAARVTEIRSGDAWHEAGPTPTQFENLMLATCQNPDQYPYAFFPVYNPKFYTNPAASYQFINYFDYPTQKFKVADDLQTAAIKSAEAPWFKLTYIIKKLATYLGLNPTGSFVTDELANSYYIYTRKCIGPVRAYRSIPDSMSYMPNITVAEFFKQVRERLHVAFDFDLSNSTLSVESFRSIAESTDVFDLSPYLSEVSAQEPSEQKGYKVFLKPDEQDELFLKVENEEDKYYPSFELIVGNGEKEVPVECSSLKKIDLSTPEVKSQCYPSTSQEVFQPIGVSEWFPELTDPNDPTTRNNWPLRLMQYNGMQQLQAVPAGLFPEAVPLDLNADDEQWYKFLNDSKKVKLRGYLPPHVLVNMRNTDKYSFISKEGYYVECLLEKLSYNLSKTNKLIPTQAEVRTLRFTANTKTVIRPGDKSDIEAELPLNGSVLVKAYFNPFLHQIKEVNAEIVGIGNAAGVPYKMETIVLPTDKWGVGGTNAWLRRLNSTGGRQYNTVEIRIREGEPKYIAGLYDRYEFVWDAAGYYKVQIDLSGDARREFAAYWIVF